MILGIHPVEWFTSRELNICTDMLLPQNWHQVFSAYWSQTGSQKPGVPATVCYHFPPADSLNPCAVMHKEPAESLIIVPAPEDGKNQRKCSSFLCQACACANAFSQRMFGCVDSGRDAESLVCRVSRWVFVSSAALWVGDRVDRNWTAQQGAVTSVHTFIVTQTMKMRNFCCIFNSWVTTPEAVCGCGHTLVDEGITSWHLFPFVCLLQHSMNGFPAVTLASCPSGMLSGTMWSLATYCWCLASNYLSPVISFPLVSAVSASCSQLSRLF